MSIAYPLVVLGIALLGAAVAALFWAVDSGQFDDLQEFGAMALDDDRVNPDGTPASPRAGRDPPAS